MNRRVKKYIKLIILSILLLVCLSTCGKKHDDYSDGGDSQFYWYYTNMAKGSEGYYYQNTTNKTSTVIENGVVKEVDNYDRWTVYYIDPENNEADIWCYKADCSHNSFECNGIFDREKWYGVGPYFYNNKVCLISMDDEGIYLEAFDEDGSNQERVCKITDRDIPFFLLILHRGYLYYETNQGVYRREIEKNSVEECIYKKENPDKESCGHLFAMENMVYYSVRKMDESGSVSTVYRYNIENGEQEELLTISQENLFTFVTPDNQSLYYYKAGEGVCKHEIENKQETVIYAETDKAGRDICTDGKYLYVDNVKAIIWPEDFLQEGNVETRLTQVFDFSGNLVCEFEPATEFLACFMGDEDYFFTRGDGELAYLPKEKLLQGNTEWIKTGIDE